MLKYGGAHRMGVRWAPAAFIVGSQPLAAHPLPDTKKASPQTDQNIRHVSAATTKHT